jgi:hypothetical protein
VPTAAVIALDAAGVCLIGAAVLHRRLLDRGRLEIMTARLLITIAALGALAWATCFATLLAVAAIEAH